MGDRTKISWADASWSPVRGCTEVDTECLNCYAKSYAADHAKTGQSYEGLAVAGPQGPRWTGKLALVPKHLDDPLHWRKPRLVFVNSMSDLFHWKVPADWVEAVFDVMRRAPQHRFLVLTKRPENILAKVPMDYLASWNSTYRHVMLGTSCGRRVSLDRRLPALLSVPCATRVLSAEPLLGPLDLLRHLSRYDPAVGGERPLGWVIAGGESGPKSKIRPLAPGWVRRIRDVCAAYDVPFFFKQWGSISNNPLKSDPTAKENGGTVKGGERLDGRIYHERPPLPSSTNATLDLGGSP